MLILLHLVGDDEPILVNMAHVVTITELGDHGCGSELWFDRHQETGLVVSENLQEIWAKL